MQGGGEGQDYPPSWPKFRVYPPLSAKISGLSPLSQKPGPDKLSPLSQTLACTRMVDTTISSQDEGGGGQRRKESWLLTACLLAVPEVHSTHV